MAFAAPARKTHGSATAVGSLAARPRQRAASVASARRTGSPFRGAARPFEDRGGSGQLVRASSASALGRFGAGGAGRPEVPAAKSDSASQQLLLRLERVALEGDQGFTGRNLGANARRLPAKAATTPAKASSSSGRGAAGGSGFDAVRIGLAEAAAPGAAFAAASSSATTSALRLEPVAASPEDSVLISGRRGSAASLAAAASSAFGSCGHNGRSCGPSRISSLSPTRGRQHSAQRDLEVSQLSTGSSAYLFSAPTLKGQNKNIVLGGLKVFFMERFGDLRQAFDCIDFHRDGRISCLEFQEVLSGQERYCGLQEARDIFCLLARGSDGWLTWEHFSQRFGIPAGSDGRRHSRHAASGGAEPPAERQSLPPAPGAGLEPIAGWPSSIASGGAFTPRRNGGGSCSGTGLQGSPASVCSSERSTAAGHALRALISSSPLSNMQLTSAASRNDHLEVEAPAASTSVLQWPSATMGSILPASVDRGSAAARVATVASPVRQGRPRQAFSSPSGKRQSEDAVSPEAVVRTAGALVSGVGHAHAAAAAEPVAAAAGSSAPPATAVATRQQEEVMPPKNSAGDDLAKHFLDFLRGDNDGGRHAAPVASAPSAAAAAAAAAAADDAAVVGAQRHAEVRLALGSSLQSLPPPTAETRPPAAAADSAVMKCLDDSLVSFRAEVAALRALMPGPYPHAGGQSSSLGASQMGGSLVGGPDALNASMLSVATPAPAVTPLGTAGGPPRSTAAALLPAGWDVHMPALPSTPYSAAGHAALTPPPTSALQHSVMMQSMHLSGCGSLVPTSKAGPWVHRLPADVQGRLSACCSLQEALDVLEEAMDYVDDPPLSLPGGFAAATGNEAHTSAALALVPQRRRGRWRSPQAADISALGLSGSSSALAKVERGAAAAAESRQAVSGGVVAASLELLRSEEARAAELEAELAKRKKQHAAKIEEIQKQHKKEQKRSLRKLLVHLAPPSLPKAAAALRAAKGEASYTPRELRSGSARSTSCGASVSAEPAAGPLRQQSASSSRQADAPPAGTHEPSRARSSVPAAVVERLL
eukprot:TRINITY_DN11135_c0_g2_i1.p1 TRINITY_DN11135_c0_g2~~TRINITY_DN11135_c0_g2_i1.p1  ORF type:complete len:1050 (-),score=275.49 TRINITY_DN11135_c0_g2_i1:63-3212(-)